MQRGCRKEASVVGCDLRRLGMKVDVTLSAAAAASVPAMQEALAAYLFEAQVRADSTSALDPGV